MNQETFLAQLFKPAVAGDSTSALDLARALWWINLDLIKNKPEEQLKYSRARTENSLFVFPTPELAACGFLQWKRFSAGGALVLVVGCLKVLFCFPLNPVVGC